MKYSLGLLLLLAACGSPGTGSYGPATVTPSAAPDVTPVQFCLGAAMYPSTFPEYGLCIDGNLYAVYSTNGGFLALLPPGQYNSNAVGSSCNFTVQPNCGVTR